jgi:HD superfamily phosphohydrolase
MENNYRHKIIIDPVHGDIGLSELETKIIDTPTFQRLRRLKQLGLASMVYPNASYSRFTHSLGVLYIASRVIEIFKKRKLITDEEDIQKHRIAALLHDIGHYPYSHLMERIDWEQHIARYLERIDQNGTDGDPQISPYPTHEKLARLIVTKREDIRQILQQAEIDPEEIAALIEGEHPGPNLLHRSLDVDRMDYLARDAFNTGVPYGKVDLNYILNNLDVVDENRIVLNSKARVAAEHLLIARYFMHNTVYFHKTVLAFEEIVRKIILMLLAQGDDIYKSGDEIEKLICDDSNEFLDFHDGYLDRFIDNRALLEDDNPLTVLCRCVRLRQPPRLIREHSELYKPKDERLSPECTNFKGCQKKLSKIAEECGISPDHLIFSEQEVGFESMEPFVSISQTPDAQEQEIERLIHIKEPSGKCKPLVADPNSIIHHLSNLRLKKICLYAVGADEKKAEEIKNAVQKRL